MTRRDYETLADALRMVKPPTDKEHIHFMTQWRVDVLYIANALSADNVSFDRKKFYKACGFE